MIHYQTVPTVSITNKMVGKEQNKFTHLNQHAVFKLNLKCTNNRITYCTQLNANCLALIKITIKN